MEIKMIENHVTSLELSKRLKELGVPQNSLFCWTTENDLEFLPTEIRNNNVCISAFLASELAEMLPNKHFNFYKNEDGYIYSLFGEPNITNTNFANGAAQMLIQLIENNIIKAEDLK